MKVHIFDPQLNYIDGHYVNYDDAIVTELRRRGIHTIVYGSAQQSSSIGSGLSVQPVFRRGLFDEVIEDPFTWPLDNLVRLGGQFHLDLSTVDQAPFSADDLVLFPNILQYQIEGIRFWLLNLPAERRPRVMIKLGWLTFAMPHYQHRQNKELLALLYRFTVRRLVAAHPRTWICSDTEEMVSQFETICGVKVHMLPLPVIIDDLPLREAGSTRVCVAYLGHASMFKGVHLLPEIIRSVVARENAPHFLIQVYGDPQLCATLQKEIAGCPADAVTLTVGAVDPEAYRRFLQQAQIVLLPYAKEFYGWASSGIFSEAMSSGKVVVVTADTWLSRQLEKFNGGGVTVAGLNAQEIAGAIRQAVGSLPQLTKLASTAAPLWRKQNSPSSFVDKVLGLVA
jgi:glycosyltransferase involved in cell wall biosynthesis